MNEPVAELLGRFEEATTAALNDVGVKPVELYSRLASAKNAEEFLRNAPTIMWHGHLIANPAYELPEEAFDIVDDGEGLAIRINSDSYWDNLPEEQRPFYVKHVDIPVALSEAVATGADRKSTRLNSSHVAISYAVFCL